MKPVYDRNGNTWCRYSNGIWAYNNVATTFYTDTFFTLALKCLNSGQGFDYEGYQWQRVGPDNWVSMRKALGASPIRRLWMSDAFIRSCANQAILEL